MNDEAGKYESGISEDAGCYAEDDRAGSRTQLQKKTGKFIGRRVMIAVLAATLALGNHRICRCFISNEE